MANILTIGKSALLAAQVGIDVTGHNIANASTPGYNRQIIQQAAVGAQNFGYGYVGKGAEIVAVTRVYNEFTAAQVRSTQTSYSQLDTYYTQIQQIDNMLADSSVGLSPSLQDFFSGVQDVASNPSSAATRQSMLSSAQSLVSQFNSLSQQLTEIQQGLNTQIAASTTSINSYAQQIAKLNDAIEKAMGSSDGTPPNDLLDQRDQLVNELSKEVRVTIVKQNNSYDVYIGNGLPLVVGARPYSLSTVTSPTDPSRFEVAYTNTSGTTTILSDNTISGGNLSGLLEFRSETLDVAQNSMGRIAIALASTFNDQHQLGLDQNGDLGGDFFTVASPVATANTNNTSAASLNATITDAKLLTTSDYRVALDAGGNYVLTRLSDNTVLSSTTLAAAQAAAAGEGFNFTVTGTPAANDDFLIRPTVNGASGIGVAITDVTKIAVAAPILGSAASSNTGTGKITSGTVSSGPPVDANLLQTVTITFNADGTYNVTGTGTGNPTNQTLATDGTITYNGWTVKISGTPATGDTFTVAENASGVGDNRNALLLANLQTTNQVAGSTTTYQGAYSQLVNLIGNKTSELEVTSAAAETLYTSTYNLQQSESGVNLDEEAAELLRYQQAYQAAAKMMKVASDLFDTLLAIG